MKQRWIFKIIGVTLAFALALLCFSCTGFFEIEGVEKITPYNNPDAIPTLVIFNNEANKFAVDVFSSPFSRDNKDKPIISVSGYDRSNPLSWVATGEDGYDFYLTYNFTFAGNKIPYIPPTNSPVYSINVRINRGQNIVPIPALGPPYIDPDVRLSNDIWLLIKNTGASQLRLLSGVNILTNENNEITVANGGGIGLYKLAPTASPSSYKILVGTTETPLPQSLPIFNPGSVHEITFNGIDATLVKITELKLNNL